MKITQKENELLLEMIRENGVKEYDPSKHVTYKVLSQELDISIESARRTLEKKYDNGDVDRERVRIGNTRWTWGYFKPE